MKWFLILNMVLAASVSAQTVGVQADYDTGALLPPSVEARVAGAIAEEVDPVWGAVSNTVTTGAALGATAYQAGGAFDYSWITNAPSLFLPDSLAVDYASDWLTLTNAIAGKQDAGDYLTPDSDLNYLNLTNAPSLFTPTDLATDYGADWLTLTGSVAGVDGRVTTLEGQTNVWNLAVDRTDGTEPLADATVIDRSVMVVDGFGFSGVNGEYTITGEANGFPRYSTAFQGNPEGMFLYRVSWGRQQWWFQEQTSGDGYVLYESVDDPTPASPDLVILWEVTIDGSPPIGTVTAPTYDLRDTARLAAVAVQRTGETNALDFTAADVRIATATVTNQPVTLAQLNAFVPPSPGITEITASGATNWTPAVSGDLLRLTLTGDVTLTLGDPAATNVPARAVVQTINATATNALTVAGNVRLPGGVQPVISTGTNAVDRITYGWDGAAWAEDTWSIGLEAP